MGKQNGKSKFDEFYKQYASGKTPEGDKKRGLKPGQLQSSTVDILDVEPDKEEPQTAGKGSYEPGYGGTVIKEPIEEGDKKPVGADEEAEQIIDQTIEEVDNYLDGPPPQQNEDTVGPPSQQEYNKNIAEQGIGLIETFQNLEGQITPEEKIKFDQSLQERDPIQKESLSQSVQDGLKKYGLPWQDEKERKAFEEGIAIREKRGEIKESITGAIDKMLAESEAILKDSASPSSASADPMIGAVNPIDTEFKDQMLTASYAVDNLKKIKHMLDDDNNPIWDFMVGAKDQGSTLLPFIGAVIDMDYNKSIQGIISKQNAGEDLTKQETSFIKTVGLINYITGHKISNNDAYEQGAMFSQMVPYALEFAMTSGAFTAGRAGVQSLTKAGTKYMVAAGQKELLKKIPAGVSKYMTRGTSFLGGVMTQANVNAQRWIAETERRMTPQVSAVWNSDYDEIDKIVSEAGEPIDEAFFKAYGTHLSEFLTERFGEYIVRGGKKLAQSAGFGDLMKTVTDPKIFGKYTMSQFMTKHNITDPKKAAALMKKAGWNGVILEIWGEEYPNMIINAGITGDQSIAEAMDITNPELIKMIPSMLVMQGTFYAPTAASKAFYKGKDLLVDNLANSVKKPSGGKGPSGEKVAPPIEETKLPESKNDTEVAKTETEVPEIDTDVQKTEIDVSKTETANTVDKGGFSDSIYEKIVKKIGEGNEAAVDLAVEYENSGAVVTEEWMDKADEVLKEEPTSAAPETKETTEKPTTTEGGEASPMSVTNFPTKEISEDLDRFQTRREAFSENSVKSIVEAVQSGEFNINKFDPVRLWKDPKNGKTFMLAGHSRTEAFRRLEGEWDLLSDSAKENLKKQGITSFKDIPSIMMDNINEEAAVKYAKRESNVMGSKETNLDVASEIKKMREAGTSNREIEETFKNYSNTKRKVLFSYLNPKGKTYYAIDILEQNDQSDSRVQQLGDFIGQARRDFPQLTDSHENELYDFLVEGPGKGITQRTDFMNRVSNVVNNVAFVKDKPLNISKRPTTGNLESELRANIKETSKKIEGLERERTKTKSGARVEEINREIESLSKELVRLNASIPASKEADRKQFDIFSAEAIPKKEEKPTKQQELKEKEDAIRAKLTEKLKSYGKPSGKITTGIDPEKIKEAAEIIGLAAELGYVKFQQLVAFIKDQEALGGDWLKENYNSLKAGYVSAKMGLGEFEDFNKIGQQDIEAATTEGYELNKKLEDDKLRETGSSSQGEQTSEVSGVKEKETTERLPEPKGNENVDADAGSSTKNRDQPSEGSGVERDSELDSGGEPGNVDVNKELGGTTKTQPTPEPGEGVITNRQTKNRDFVIPPDFSIGKQSVKQRMDQNLDALKILESLAKGLINPSDITYEDQQTLFKYSGFGGIPMVRINARQTPKYFDSEADRDRVLRLYDHIEGIFGEKKLKPIVDGLLQNTVTAYYTPPEVIRGIYKALQAKGFKGGRILEPSSGSGNFIGAMPPSIRKASAVDAVEIDPISAKIAETLYPSARVQNKGLQDANIPDNYYDLVISNIPFGDFKVFDKKFSTGRLGKSTALKNIHSYFFAKALDVVKPGGIVAFVTSTGVLDSERNAVVRKYLGTEGKFLGAIKMPKQTFEGNTNTSVVADIILFQKHSEKEEKTQPYKSYPFKSEVVNTNSGEVSISGYFKENPNDIIGKLEVGGMYGNKGYTVNDVEGVDIEKVVFEKLSEKIQPIQSPDVEAQKELERNFEKYLSEDSHPGEIVLQKGKMGILNENREFIPVQLGNVSQERVAHFIALRNSMSDLIKNELNADPNAEEARKKFNGVYDSFVSEYGRLRDKGNKFIANDINFYNLFALENYDKETEKFLGKADIFKKATIRPVKRAAKAETPREAVYITMSEKGHIDMGRVASLLNVTEHEAIEQTKDTVFELPEGGFETREVYLSGNVKVKLAQAQAAAERNERFNENVEALKAVQPVDLPIQDITVQMGARWVPQEVYTSFLENRLGLSSFNYDLKYLESQNEWSLKISKETEEISEFDVSRMNGPEIIQKAINGRYPRFTDTIKNPDGTTTSVPNLIATQEAERAINKVREAFTDFIMEDPEYGNKVATVYNHLFNNTVAPSFDGDWLSLPGYAGPAPYKHQLDGAAMVIQNNGGILDQIVGAGKTILMITAAVEMKRMGIVKKPMIIGKKINTIDIGDEARRVYPHAKILTIDRADFSKDGVRSTLATIANNDWDLIVITHDNFKLIPTDPDIAQKTLDEELYKIDIDIDFIIEEEGPRSRKVQGLIKKRENIMAAMDKLVKQKDDKTMRNFKELGVDHIIVDEYQVYKNAPYHTRQGDIKGLGPQSGSANGSSLLMAARSMQALYGADKGLTIASGTMIENSVVEMYNIMNLMRPSKLREMSLNSFDEWANVFAVPTNDVELTVTGDVKQNMRFRKFINLPELTVLYREIADVRNDENMVLPKPEKVTIIKSIEALAPNLKMAKRILNFTKTGNPKDISSTLDGPIIKTAKMLVAANIAAKAAIDLRMVIPGAPDLPNSKANVVADMIIKRYNDTDHWKGTQIIFTNLRNGPDGFDLHEEIKQKLIDRGVSADEIAWPQSTASKTQGRIKSDEQRKALFEKVNSGKIRVLIGNINTLGVGVNVQERVSAVYQLEPGYNSSKHIQADGRAWRQGNIGARDFQDNKVYSIWLGMENSLDAFKIQLQDTKGKMIQQVKDGSTTDRIVEERDGDGDINLSEFMAALTGNTAIIDKARVEEDIRQLSNEKKAHSQKVYTAKAKLTEAKSQLEVVEKNKVRFDQDLSNVKDNVKRDADGGIIYQVTIEGKTYTKPSEAGKVLFDKGMELLKYGQDGERVTVGYIYGLPMTATLKGILGMETQLSWAVMGPSGLSYTWGTPMGTVASSTEGKERVYTTLGRFPKEAIEKISRAANKNNEKAEAINKQIPLFEKNSKETFDRDEEIETLRAKAKKIDEEIEKYDMSDDLGESTDDLFEGIDDAPLAMSEESPDKGKKTHKKGRKPLGLFEKRDHSGTTEREGDIPFKIQQVLIDLVRKYAPDSKIGQGYKSKGALGTYFSAGKHIRVSGMNDYDVAIHELVHAVDDHHKVIRKLIANTSNGDQIRKRLTDIYEDLYPKADRGHPLQTRMFEGMAVLIQTMVNNPTFIERNFSDLAKELYTDGGLLNFPGVKEFVQEASDMVAEYQSLRPLQKAYSRIYDHEIDPKTDKPFLNNADLATWQVFDHLHPWEVLGKKAGTHFTSLDAAQHMRASMQSVGMATHNIKSDEHWVMNDKGDWVKKQDFGFATIKKMVEKDMDDWNGFLVHRRIHFDYQRRDEYREEKRKARDEITDLEARLKAGNLSSFQEAKIKSELNDARNREAHFEERELYLTKILDNDQITQLEAQEGFDEGKDKFKKPAEMLDELQQEDLKLLHHPDVGIINDEQYNEYSNRTGYVTFRRHNYDEHLQSPDAVEDVKIDKSKNVRVKSMMTRKGSTRPIINPFVASMINHIEIMQKAHLQKVLNVVGKNAKHVPDMIRKTPYYPGIEKDPNVIITRNNGVKAAYILDSMLKTSLDENYEIFNPNVLNKTFIELGRIFRAGTTTLWTPFAIANTFLDQATAYVNSLNNYKPFIEPIFTGIPAMVRSWTVGTTIGKAVSIKETADSKFFDEYIFQSGRSHLLINESEDVRRLRAPELNEKFSQKLSRFNKNVTTAVSMPGNVSELATRVSEYIKARKNGHSQVIALEMAGRVSTPFHHRGRLKFGMDRSVIGIVRAIPYFNSSLQVLAQMITTGKTKEGKIKLAKMMIFYAGATASSTYAMFFAGDDDEERKRRLEIMKGIDPEMLSKYIFAPNPFDKGSLLQLRASENLMSLAAVTNMALISHLGETSYTTGEYADAVTSWVPDQLNPFSGWDMMFSYIPPSLKSTVEVAGNFKSFPSIHALESPFLGNTRPSQRTDKNTSWLAGSIGEALEYNDLDIRLNISPKKIDHLIYGFFGRSSGLITGKPGGMGQAMKRSLVRELYMEGTRQMQYYWETRELTNQKFGDLRENPEKYSKEEEEKILKMMEELYGDKTRMVRERSGKIKTVYRKGNGLDDLWNTYRDVDDDQEPRLAAELRGKIFDRISSLQKIERK